MSCGSLNTIEFSTNTTTQGDDLYLDQINVMCISGYQQNGGDLVRNCTSAGTWDGAKPRCTSKFHLLKTLKTDDLLTVNYTFNLTMVFRGELWSTKYN